MAATPRKYDLEERTLQFAKNVRAFVKKFPRSSTRESDIDQVIRSSGSVGANYIEANESLSKKDFVMRIKICRKEVKETHYWLSLFPDSLYLKAEVETLKDEAKQLERIFGAIVRTSTT